MGRLYLAEGNQKEAVRYFKLALKDEEIDDQFHQLLKARIYEGMALANEGDESKSFILQLYGLYPQLMPFSNLTMPFQLKVEGKISEADENVLDELRDCHINFDEAQAPTLTISFAPLSKATAIHYTVQQGEDIFQTGTLRVEDHERNGAGKLLAYRLFGIQKNRIGEKPVVSVSRPVQEKVKEENKEAI